MDTGPGKGLGCVRADVRLAASGGAGLEETGAVGRGSPQRRTQSGDDGIRIYQLKKTSNNHKKIICLKTKNAYLFIFIATSGRWISALMMASGMGQKKQGTGFTVPCG
jgi:hypothetical protein